MQAEIIKRLPVKSLIQFQSVSKAWKSLINSPDFIAQYSNHSNHHIQVPNILIRYTASIGFKRKYISMVNDNDNTLSEYKYVSITDDDSFPKQKSSLRVPLLVRFLKRSTIIGSSHGLLCLYGDYKYGSRFGKARVVLWNLLIGKVVAVVVRNVTFTRHYSADAESYMTSELYGSVLGFGVCRETTDPKIVKINYINTNYPSDMKSVNHIPSQVEVFTLSARAWRRPHSNLPRKSISFVQFGVVVEVGGVLYWLARDRIVFDGRFRYSYHLLVSFDLTTEEFKEVNLPDSLARGSGYNLSIYNQRGSLIVVERHIEAVWMMVNGVPSFFTNLFTISNTPHVSTVYVYVRGFRKTGEPIIEIEKDHSQCSGERPLGVYEPYSERVNYVGISGVRNSFSMYSYSGTLLLLDQPYAKIYDKRLVPI